MDRGPHTLIITALLFICCGVWSSVLSAQEVIISPDINIKLDKKYVVLGKKKDHILLFRDQVKTQNIDVFDENLKYKYTREVVLNRIAPNIIAVVSHRNSASIIYSSSGKDSLELHQYVINDLGEMQDTVVLGTYPNKRFKGNFRYSYSEDNNSIAVFTKGKESSLNLFMIDLNAQKISWESEIKSYEPEPEYKFKDMVISNEQEVIMLYERWNNRTKAKSHSILIKHISEGMSSAYEAEINMPQYLSKDIHLTYDDVNEAILVIGLYTEANRSSALGYFYYSTPLSSMSADGEVVYQPFDQLFVQTVNGKRRGVNNTLDYYFIKDVVFQQDGSFLWIGEMYKQYIRRTPSPYNRAGDGLTGFIDHYTEDVIVVSVDKSHTELWKNVIYKKQFSQDDDAIYSSYGLMKTPSRFQIIFNDEVKKNNTASSYSLDPIGNMVRKTVLNTEYENLRLRFEDAEQISSNSILVVSETSGALNLVKITF